VSDREGIVEFPCDVERLPNGNTLITDAGDEAGQGSEIVEVNPAGEIVWQYGEGLAFAHSAKRLPDGRTLIADTTNDRILEVDMAGRVVLSSDEWNGGTGRLSDGSHLWYPNDAHPLAGDRLLITDRNNDRVIITDRRGQLLKAWREGLRHPHNGDLLPGGHLLAADSDGNAVVEFDGPRDSPGRATPIDSTTAIHSSSIRSTPGSSRSPPPAESSGSTRWTTSPTSTTPTACPAATP
jgi:hypothetical protein